MAFEGRFEKASSTKMSTPAKRGKRDSFNASSNNGSDHKLGSSGDKRDWNESLNLAFMTKVFK